MKTSYTLRDTWDIFPRGQHPDTRTNKEWLMKMGFIKNPRVTNPRYPKDLKKGYPNRKPVICITTGEEFKGINMAEAHYGIAKSNLGKHLKGDDQYRHVKGLQFRYL